MKTKKLSHFYKFIESTSLEKKDKKAIKFMIDFLRGEFVADMSSKSYLFSGAQGVGKTYLVERLINVIDMPVLFLGACCMKGEKIKKAASLNDLVKQLDKFNEGIIFIDDLKYALKFDDLSDIDDEEEKRFMALLEHIKRSRKNVVLLITLNESSILDDSFLDRIEVKINIEFPSEENKFNFLKKNFRKYAKLSELRYLATNSVGHNYRDLPEVIKIAYREGDKQISLEGLKKALVFYIPSSFSRYKIKNSVSIKFKDLIGNDNAKFELGRLKDYIKNKGKFEKLGIKNSNLFIFAGPPGTGKTYMALALAGELEVPLVKISAVDLYRDHPIFSLNRIAILAKRFKNCVIFIDEADKVLGRMSSFSEEDGINISEFNTEFTDAQNSVQSIIIMAMNNPNRFGNSLHDRFSIIKFENPDETERKEFLMRLAERGQVSMKKEIEEMAKTTEGMSYREMQRLWNSCMFYYLQNNKIDLEKIRNFASREKSYSSMFG